MGLGEGEPCGGFADAGAPSKGLGGVLCWRRGVEHCGRLLGVKGLGGRQREWHSVRLEGMSLCGGSRWVGVL